MSIETTILCAAALGLVLLARRLIARERALAAAEAGRRAAESGHADLLRHMRLAAHDMRGIGMTIHGHADHLAAEGHHDAQGVAGGAADLLDLADDVQDLTLEAAAPRVLREEDVALGAAIDEAIADVGAMIQPGRRNWRVQPELRAIWLHGDRRAIRHAVSRVLADAVRNTAQEDWIDLGVERARAGVENGSLIVWIADEGKGTLKPEAVAARRDSRGIGTRLTLARLLVEAHGGHMEVVAQTGVGSRVSLVFPAARLVTPPAGGPAPPLPSPPSRSYAARVPVAGYAGR